MMKSNDGYFAEQRIMMYLVGAGIALVYLLNWLLP